MSNWKYNDNKLGDSVYSVLSKLGVRYSTVVVPQWRQGEVAGHCSFPRDKIYTKEEDMKHLPITWGTLAGHVYIVGYGNWKAPAK